MYLAGGAPFELENRRTHKWASTSFETLVSQNASTDEKMIYGHGQMYFAGGRWHTKQIRYPDKKRRGYKALRGDAVHALRRDF